MSSFVIEGLAGTGKGLSGTVEILGMKNAVLPIMAAATLIDGESALTNVPDISDVVAMSELIEGLGGKVVRQGSAMIIDARRISHAVLDPELAKRMRASVLLTGPLLARMGSVTFPHPGGCVLGARPIDIFVTGFEKLGAIYTEHGESYTLSAPSGLSGGEVHMRVVSVTATETFMMAGTAASSTVVLHNCAMEPEVVATADFLNAAGAHITGAGTPTITITPSHLRAGTPCRIIPDRIEAACFLMLGALAGQGTGVCVSGAEPAHMWSVIETLKSMGVDPRVDEHGITVVRPTVLMPIDVRTHEYPGFPTDAQAPLAVLMTQAEGESSILETIFDGRLNYTSELARMGAYVQLWNPHKVTIRGKTLLKSRDIDGPDIRAGLAFVLAAIIAEGTSTIGNAHLVDRGYQNIEERLRALGVSINRQD